MRKPKKHAEKLVPAICAAVLFSLVAGCDRAPSENALTVYKGDAKVATERIAEADKLYEEREDLSKARVAVAALRQAQTADYGNYEASWKLARAAFYVGDRTDNDSEQDAMFREGTQAGKAAVTLQPDKPDGHFWLGANYGGTAASSTLANLSSFRDIKNEMETVLKLDEGYHGYSAYLGLGRLYLQAPSVLGGDSQKAIAYLEKGVKLNPNHGLMRFHLAEAYAENNRTAEAKKQLEALMALTPNPNYAAEHKQAVEKAKKLLEKIESNRR